MQISDSGLNLRIHKLEFTKRGYLVSKLLRTLSVGFEIHKVKVPISGPFQNPCSMFSKAMVTNISLGHSINLRLKFTQQIWNSLFFQKATFLKNGKY